MASSNASYLLRSQAKCLVPHTAEQERHSFLVGTSNLRGPNDIRVLRYYEDEDELDCVASYAHEGEVSSMSACPHDAAVVMTTSTTSEGLPCASIYRMHDLPGDAEDEERYLAGEEGGVADPAERKRTLEKLVALPSQRPGCRLLQVQFVPAEGSSLMGGDEGGNTAAASGGVESCKVLAVDDTSLRLFTLTNDGSLKLSLKLDGGGEMVTEDATFIGGIAWDALNYGTAAIAHDSTVSFWDTRSGDRTRVIERAVPAGCVVRGLSFNPNKPWHVATGGDDYQVKIWDTRKAASGPVKVLQGHTHGVTCVAYNGYHDQLLLSGGSDGRVNLWRASSVSSAPLLELGEEDLLPSPMAAGAAISSVDSHSHGHGHKKHEPKLAADVAIRTTTAHTAAGTHHHHHGSGSGHLTPAAAALADAAAEGTHEDSVYSVAWSPGSAWVYASLSYTSGRVTVGNVPSAEKYKILL